MITFNKSVSIVFVVLLFSAFNLARLEISNTPNTYIPDHLPSKILSDELTKEFNNDDTLVIVFDVKDALNVNFLKNFSQSLDEISSFDQTDKINSIFSYESIRSVDGGFEIKNILDKENLDQLDHKLIAESVIKDRFVKDLFITKEMKTFGIVIETKLLTNSISRIQYEESVFNVFKKFNIEKNISAYGGEFSVDTAQFAELNRVMFIIVPITFILGVLLLYFLFNATSAVIFGTMINGFVAMCSLSLFGFFGWPYNMIGSMIPTLMMALSIAYIVHLYNGILLRKENGESHVESVKNTVTSIKSASFYSALTTSCGLFSLAISDIPPIKHVAVVGGIGVMFIYFMVIFILPNFLLRFDNSEWKQNIHFKKVLDSIISYFFHLAIKFKYQVIVTSLILTSVLSLFIFNVQSESNLYKFFADDHPVNLSADYIKEKFSGTTLVNLSFKSDQPGIMTSEFNNKIDKLKNDILAINDVSRVFSATDILKQMNWAFHDENNKYFSVPDNSNLIEQYLFVYDGLDLYNFLNRNNDHFKMTINLDVQGANEIENILDQINHKINKIGFSNYQWGFAAYGKMFSDQENLIISDLFNSMGISFLVIFTLMSVLWRSPFNAFICMLPNLSPILGMFILMGIFGIWLDMGTAMIASVTIGIAVDDTIHVFTSFLKKKKTLPIDNALKETFEESGRAIIITSFILSVQFGILLCTEFTPLRNFGLLTMVGIITALLYDILFLPSLLKIIYKK